MLLTDSHLLQITEGPFCPPTMARKRPKKGFKEQARTHSKTTPRRRIDSPGGANERRGETLLDLTSLTQLTAGTDFSSAIDPKASPFVSARPRVVLPKAKETRHFLFLPDRPRRAPRPLVHSHQQEKHWSEVPRFHLPSLA